PGLLFLATEHGVYMSFDAGENWQSLQLNLPDTPIRDLVIKDADVVLGSHGRGFWILDDIGPLRQLTSELAKQDVILFKPEDAIRSVYNAKIQYYLKEAVDSVTIEIMDSKGEMIRSFVGKQKEKKEGGRSSGPAVTAGMHSFSWDLRYSGATTFDGMIIWSARPQRGPKAPIGDYQVKLTAGDYSKTYGFKVKMNPNWKGVTEKDLQEQFDLAMKIVKKTSEANKAVIKIREVRAEMEKETDQTRIDKMKATIADMTAIEEDLYQVRNRSGQDPLNFPIKLNNRLASLRRSMENGDAKPTAGAYQVFDELSAELAGHLKKLEGVMKKAGVSVGRD
ncbi:MAG: glycosyl hydrolase, partial [Bacteroidota bacterium]